MRPLLAVPLLASLLACGDAAVEDRFLGRIEGTDALVAAVASADTAIFYACGGPASFESLSHWFEVDRGPDGLSGSVEGVRLDAAPRGEGYAGTLTVGETAHPVVLERVIDDEPVLFTAEVEGKGRAGVIGYGEGEARATQGTFLWTDGPRSQIFVVRQPSARGFEVRVAGRGAADFRVAVAPVGAPARAR
jgi:hypothetical protein